MSDRGVAVIAQSARQTIYREELLTEKCTNVPCVIQAANLLTLLFEFDHTLSCQTLHCIRIHQIIRSSHVSMTRRPTETDVFWLELPDRLYVEVMYELIDHLSGQSTAMPTDMRSRNGQKMHRRSRLSEGKSAEQLKRDTGRPVDCHLTGP
jgi:hypothetical protein